MYCDHCGAPETALLLVKGDTFGPFIGCIMCGSRVALWYDNPHLVGPLPSNDPVISANTHRRARVHTIPTTCVICHEEFIPGSGTAIYCPDCKELYPDQHDRQRLAAGIDEPRGKQRVKGPGTARVL